MSVESTFVQAGDTVTRTAVSAYSAYQVGQAPDGRAFAVRDSAGISAGAAGTLYMSGVFTLAKATGFVALAGLPAYWDASANNVTYKDAGDADFLVGVFVDDALSAADTCSVALNVRPSPKIDLLRDPADDANVTGTQALGGFLPPRRVGGKWQFKLSSTSEQQVVDLLSQTGFKASGASAVVRMVFNVVLDGATGNQDANLGIASASHASDADSIAQHLFCHLDGNSVNINFQSKDGTTTVAATDSTIDYTESGTVANRVEVWFDLRNAADVQVYVNGSAVLTSTTFNVNAAASEWKALIHLEKASGAETYTLEVHAFEVYTADERDALSN